MYAMHRFVQSDMTAAAGQQQQQYEAVTTNCLHMPSLNVLCSWTAWAMPGVVM